MCKANNTGVCLNVNAPRPGAAYSYIDIGGWIGGQAKYKMVPCADFNLLKFPDKAVNARVIPLEKRHKDIRTLTEEHP